MTDTTEISPELRREMAQMLGAHPDEIVALDHTDAGGEIAMFDGTTYVVVTEDRPDAAGRTGLMYRYPPCDGYAGTFPIYRVHHTPAPGPDPAGTAAAAAEAAKAATDAQTASKAGADTKTAAAPPQAAGAAPGGPAVPVKTKAADPPAPSGA